MARGKDMKAPYCNPKIPKHHIRWKMGRVHVSASCLEIIREFYRGMKNNPEWTKELRRQVYRYAFWCHQKNIDLYRAVMG